MKCAEATNEIPNYCYGEIDSEIEEILESHLTGCNDCRTELARHRKFLELLEERTPVLDSGLLVQCRTSLNAQLRLENAATASQPAGWRFVRNAMDRLRELSNVHIPFRVPVGAMALVALGFIAARYTPEKFGGVRATLAAPLFSNVRSIEPDASGQMQIAVDEVRRHVVSGSMQDPEIQALLVSGVTEGSNPNVRLKSIQALHTATAAGAADNDQVRQALLGALEHDPTPAVRLKALDGLKQYAADANVRKALANVLQKDDNADVRVQAIDLLSAQHDDSIVGALQNVVQREDNPYVRAQVMQLLTKLKASVGTY